jgi:hypothetical protein
VQVRGLIRCAAAVAVGLAVVAASLVPAYALAGAPSGPGGQGLADTLSAGLADGIDIASSLDPLLALAIPTGGAYEVPQYRAADQCSTEIANNGGYPPWSAPDFQGTGSWFFASGDPWTSACDPLAVFPILYPSGSTIAYEPWVGRFCATVEVFEGNGYFPPASASSLAGTSWAWINSGSLPIWQDVLSATGTVFDGAQGLLDWLNAACPPAWLKTVYGPNVPVAGTSSTTPNTGTQAPGAGSSGPDSAGWDGYCNGGMWDVPRWSGEPSSYYGGDFAFSCQLSSDTASLAAQRLAAGGTAGAPAWFNWPGLQVDGGVSCVGSGGPATSINLSGQVLSGVLCMSGFSGPPSVASFSFNGPSTSPEQSYTGVNSQSPNGGFSPSFDKPDGSANEGSLGPLLMESFAGPVSPNYVPATPTDYFPGGNAGYTTTTPAPATETSPAPAPPSPPSAPAPAITGVPAGLPTSAPAPDVPGEASPQSGVTDVSDVPDTNSLLDGLATGFNDVVGAVEYVGGLLDGAIAGLDTDLNRDFSWLGDSLLGALDSIIGELSGLAGDVLSLPAAIAADIGLGLQGLFDPSTSTATEVGTSVQTTFPLSWVTALVGGGDALVTAVDGGISGGSACGPYIGWSASGPVPAWGVHLPAPSSLGCPGNGPGGAATVEDNTAGDLFGYRVVVRDALLAVIAFGFVVRLTRAAPWSGQPDDLAPNLGGD